jgi:phytoene desaturase
MKEFVFKPAHSPLEFADFKILKASLRLQLLRSLSSEVRSLFKDPRLIQLLEFPVLFLGATPDKTPAMYSMMNYADLVLGTWYPKGGMIKIVEAMVSLAEELGVRFQFNTEVTGMEVDRKKITHVRTNTGVHGPFDTVVASGDYHHLEQLLPAPYRQYDDAYWQSRVLAPSSLIFYLGLRGKLKNVLHHNLFFDRAFEVHGREIYSDPKWPTDPLFYMCVPSVTDDTVAPPDHENVFLLMPLAPGIEDRDDLREKYFDILVNRIEELTGNTIRNRIVYKRSYCINDFIADYHSFRGNAYGLANTLKQTAFLKPKMKSRKLDNLFFAGQLTVPGPGIPPAIISGQIVAKEVIQQYA